MRLKTKLVLAATVSTFAIVLVLSILFLGELLRQRIVQTAATNEVMARQVLMMTKQAVEVGLQEHPPADTTDTSLNAAVTTALRDYDALNDTMTSFILYSPAVQDVTVTDAHGLALVSSDPQVLNRHVAPRTSFDRLRDGRVLYQFLQVFGPPRVLDIAAPLERNGAAFLVVHIGIRSSFLKNNYAPSLLDALFFALVAGFIAMAAAGLLASLALRPIEEISRRLETLAVPEQPAAEERPTPDRRDAKKDAVVRVTNTIDRLGQQMKSTEAGYTGLRQSLNQVLDTLREGVILFTAERRAAMVSDAVANFTGDSTAPLLGRKLEEIFLSQSALGAAVLTAFEQQTPTTAQRVRLEDGRELEITLDRIDDRRGNGTLGTLLTLRDAGSAMRLEQELEVSRRLAAVGRLTAGVGHEVKNPINAMVVHLELLRSKLNMAGDGREFLPGAMRHVEILAGEMERLDRVVQTLADFTRPLELHLVDTDLRDIVEGVVDLTGLEMAEHHVEVRCELEPLRVRADGELLRQALLNLMLNAMQAMEAGGILRISVRRDQDAALLEVADNGAGIPPELLPRIFDLYFTTKSRGSGIGLSMTYRIVQMHGGALDVRSHDGQGSTFTVRLPLSVAANRSSRAMAGRAA